MPSKKYIITVLDGVLAGREYIKYRQCYVDEFVANLSEWDMQCKVEIIELH
jgi:hypothetical protein